MGESHHAALYRDFLDLVLPFWIHDFQDIVISNAGAWLSDATLRFSSLAEQYHTQKNYLRCFYSDFDAVKSKFGLLLE